MTTRGPDAAGGALFVRRLAPDDRDLFRQVRLAALLDAPDAFGESLETARQSDFDSRTASASSFTDRGVFLALAAEHAIGMVFVRCETPPAAAFLGGMWVDPRFRRRGMGRVLVLRGLEFLRSAGQTHVSLWVTSTHSDVLKFYRTLGFRETGATASLRPGSPLTISELCLDLQV